MNVMNVSTYSNYHTHPNLVMSALGKIRHDVFQPSNSDGKKIPLHSIVSLTSNTIIINTLFQ